MARTDGILGTETPIDSAIVGMTAMVSVNGSAFVSVFSILLLIFLHNFFSDCSPKTIELGHQGEPVQDVILRIYRQTERGNEGDRKREVIIARDEKEEMRENARYSLSDSCEEVSILFLFF